MKSSEIEPFILPHTVAALIEPYIKGLQGAGIAACAKHFPGHGVTSIDSHLFLPFLDTNMDTLTARTLYRFNGLSKPMSQPS